MAEYYSDNPTNRKHERSDRSRDSGLHRRPSSDNRHPRLVCSSPIAHLRPSSCTPSLHCTSSNSDTVNRAHCHAINILSQPTMHCRHSLDDLRHPMLMLPTAAPGSVPTADLVASSVSSPMDRTALASPVFPKAPSASATAVSHPSHFIYNRSR